MIKSGFSERIFNTRRISYFKINLFVAIYFKIEKSMYLNQNLMGQHFHITFLFVSIIRLDEIEFEQSDLLQMNFECLAQFVFPA